jgi:hypothetical protein
MIPRDKQKIQSSMTAEAHLGTSLIAIRDKLRASRNDDEVIKICQDGFTILGDVIGDAINTIQKELKRSDLDEESKKIYRRQFTNLNNIGGYLDEISSGNKVDEEQLKDLMNKIDDYIHEEALRQKIESAKNRRTMAEYGGYGVLGVKFITLFWLSQEISLANAVTKVGVIFPPLAYAFISIRALFDAGSKAYLLKATRDRAREVHEYNLKRYAQLASHSSQFVRTAAAAAAFLFNTVAAISFAMVLIGVAFPLFPAWFATASAAGVFVAAATVTGWISDSYIPSINADKVRNKLSKLDKKIAALTKERDNEPLPLKKSQINQKIIKLKMEMDSYGITLQEAKQDAANKTTETRWGFSSAFATVCTAFGPLIPLPFVGPAVALIGTALIAINAVRGVALNVKSLWDEYRKPTAQQAKEPVLTDMVESSPKHGRRFSYGAIKQMLPASESEIEMTSMKREEKSPLKRSFDLSSRPVEGVPPAPKEQPQQPIARRKISGG